ELETTAGRHTQVTGRTLPAYPRHERHPDGVPAWLFGRERFFPCLQEVARRGAKPIPLTTRRQTTVSVEAETQRAVVNGEKVAGAATQHEQMPDGVVEGNLLDQVEDHAGGIDDTARHQQPERLVTEVVPQRGR